uniref:Putative secreted protein n=1 Tax=Ixodes ricinus TaxID=34613 RepID=A0A6B0TSI4_IXORI
MSRRLRLAYASFSVFGLLGVLSPRRNALPFGQGLETDDKPRHQSSPSRTAKASNTCGQTDFCEQGQSRWHR